MRLNLKNMTLAGFLCSMLFHVGLSFAYVKGIYLSENTARNGEKMAYLIKEAKLTGLNTFVIDANARNALYEKNVKKVVANGIHYVARVTVFPGGATASQIHDRSIWEKRLALAKYAISLGADGIQLDYIRYSSKDGIASPQKARDVYRVIQYFRANLPAHIPLEIDIFGISTFKPAPTIGQNPKMFASSVNAICPMVYPSHYEPYKYYSVRPYQTIYESIEALKKQLPANSKVDIYAYIETYNYRYPMTIAERIKYGAEQIKAAKAAGAQGFYVWSASNEYSVLFSILQKKP